MPYAVCCVLYVIMLYVICHMSYVICHMSYVICHMSYVIPCRVLHITYYLYLLLLVCLYAIRVIDSIHVNVHAPISVVGCSICVIL
jgi:hypothetical protein